MSQKILGIAGSMKSENSSSEYLLSIALEAAAAPGITVEMVRLKDYHIIPCEGCGNCMNNTRCHLLENPADQYALLYEKMREADGFIFSSPVYALGLPAQWKNWLDRCEPCSDGDLTYDYYNYDRVAQVKGKALKGKVAGMIAVAAGPGHEWALASFLPAFTTVKLSMVASAGLSLIEYDGQPGIRKRSWSKPIREAEFAIMMARAVGLRVATALNYSTFDTSRHPQHPDHPRPNKETQIMPLTSIYLQDLWDHERSIRDLFGEETNILIVGNQAAAESCRTLYDRFYRECPGNYHCYLAAAVGPLPAFITRDFIKNKIQQLVGDNRVLFDWENRIAETSGCSVDSPLVLACKKNGRCTRIFAQVDENQYRAIIDFIRE
ncbi:MAG TPA: flavodoxin family protein [Candidatus Deferrimicrobium sp.]|nr:flavodoxin family protein [Candidatus Deferrimicrobium sp.]